MHARALQKVHHHCDNRVVVANVKHVLCQSVGQTWSHACIHDIMHVYGEHVYVCRYPLVVLPMCICILLRISTYSSRDDTHAACACITIR